jgi:hypothetical protein
MGNSRSSSQYHSGDDTEHNYPDPAMTHSLVDPVLNVEAAGLETEGGAGNGAELGGADEHGHGGRDGCSGKNVQCLRKE